MSDAQMRIISLEVTATGRGLEDRGANIAMIPEGHISRTRI